MARVFDGTAARLSLGSTAIESDSEEESGDNTCEVSRARSRRVVEARDIKQREN